MHALRTLGVLAFGFSLPLALLANLDQSSNPVAVELKAAARVVGLGWAGVSSGQGVAEVSVAFDSHGRVAASQLRRSSGSRRSDAAALDEAVELASLRQPGEVAGRTLLYRASFDRATQLD